MTPHRSNGRGSLLIDRRFPAPIGRLRVATKLSDPAEVAVFLDTMLPACEQQGIREDVLRAIQRRQVSVKQALAMWRGNMLQDLASAAHLTLLHEALAAYARDRQAEDEEDSEHLRKMRTTANHLKRLVPRYRVTDMKVVLPILKAAMAPSTYNQTRAHLQAFARDVHGKSSKPYEAVRDSRRKRMTKRVKGRPYGLAEVRRAEEKMTPTEAAMLWTLCTTGMMPEEYWEEARCRWELHADRIAVHGTKREARDREVPLILPPFRPVLTARKFAKRLKVLFGPTALLYDTRRTYARWMAEARLITVNRKAYLGHSKTITQLYEMGEVEGQLEADSTTMRAYLGLNTTPTRPFALIEGGAEG